MSPYAVRHLAAWDRLLGQRRRYRWERFAHAWAVLEGAVCVVECLICIVQICVEGTVIRFGRQQRRQTFPLCETSISHSLSLSVSRNPWQPWQVLAAPMTMDLICWSLTQQTDSISLKIYTVQAQLVGEVTVHCILYCQKLLFCCLFRGAMMKYIFRQLGSPALSASKTSFKRHSKNKNLMNVTSVSQARSKGVRSYLGRGGCGEGVAVMMSVKRLPPIDCRRSLSLVELQFLLSLQESQRLNGQERGRLLLPEGALLPPLTRLHQWWKIQPLLTLILHKCRANSTINVENIILATPSQRIALALWTSCTIVGQGSLRGRISGFKQAQL